MRKLNKRKIRWIVREMKKGELSVYQIAKVQEISKKWVYEIFKKYHDKNLYKPKSIEFKKAGRPARPIEEWEKELIVSIYKNLPMGAVSIERMLRQTKKELHLSHNRIHKILLEVGLSKTELKKSKRRKWVRYERKYSNSLWHTDWFEYDGKNIIIFEDDASRFVTGFGEFKNATSENSVKVLKKSVEEWGKPRQLMSDHGVQFTSIPRENYNDIPQPNVFQKILIEMGIKHIKARVKHPQSNGKLERLIATLKRYYKHFGSWEEAIRVYNFKRPHMSLEKADGTLRTPYQAFVEKMRKNKR